LKTSDEFISCSVSTQYYHYIIYYINLNTTLSAYSMKHKTPYSEKTKTKKKVHKHQHMDMYEGVGEISMDT